VVHRAVADAISKRLVLSCHDVSEGGPIVAAAEMCIASGLGMSVAAAATTGEEFDESPGRYLLEIAPENLAEARALFDSCDVPLAPFGQVLPDPVLEIFPPNKPPLQLAVKELAGAWRGTLDW
jgi:phosphoribosylformylglycinamidine synthase